MTHWGNRDALPTADQAANKKELVNLSLLRGFAVGEDQVSLSPMIKTGTDIAI